MLISDVESGRTTFESPIPGVPAFSNPTWSPDRRTIVVTGLVNGQIDLYAFDIRTQQVTQLTDNPYSELHASWSEDGSRLVFATDELRHAQTMCVIMASGTSISPLWMWLRALPSS